jgi:ubiquinone/menaquinone biosynthesis C-methylase UbiE
MNFYDERILPHFINGLCSLRSIARQRQKVVPLAEGKVLEVGMGAGLNLPFYDSEKVDFIWGLEPSEGMRKCVGKNLGLTRIPMEWLPFRADDIPLEDRSVDTVLLTYTLCTIPDCAASLRQMLRVLKPMGRLVFCEHGAAPDEGTRRWQTRFTPYWKRIAGGCHLDRPIPDYIEEAGFRITRMESEYLRGVPRIAGFTYWGIAQKV